MARTPIASLSVTRSRLTISKRVPSGVEAIVRASAPTTSEVFDTYWRFAHARQEIYMGRVAGLPAPWTSDPILLAHRFTNPYRASDRVSQYLIRRIIYSGDFDDDDFVFRVLLFKFFNKIETWEVLERELGEIRWEDYSLDRFSRVLDRAMDAGQRIYSAAYIMPACRTYETRRKHRGHLQLIAHMVRNGLALRIAEATKLGDTFDALRAYPMMGDFLAYQYAVDLNYGSLNCCEEDDFVEAGPGARDGLRKVFPDPGGYDSADLVRWVVDRQEAEFDRRGLPFQTLWGRRLRLIDCQNLFCEVDKYARVRHPGIPGLSGRTRIKQKYVPGDRLPIPFFPPKWDLNGKIAKSATSQMLPTQERLFASITQAAAV